MKGGLACGCGFWLRRGVTGSKTLVEYDGAEKLRTTIAAVGEGTGARMRLGALMLERYTMAGGWLMRP